MGENVQTNRRQRNTSETKSTIKHSVLSIAMIDELINSETDIEKIIKLKHLRGEVMKIWQQ